MTLVEHAQRELGLAVTPPQLTVCVIAAVAVVESHAGGPVTQQHIADLLFKLLRGETLTELTADPDEWEDCSHQFGTPIWRNRRDGRAYSADGGLTYTLDEGGNTDRIMRRAAPPPLWVDLLRDQRGMDPDAATAAVAAYLAGGPFTDSEWHQMRDMTEGRRDRYMAARWGPGACCAQALYDLWSTPVNALTGPQQVWARQHQALSQGG